MSEPTGYDMNDPEQLAQYNAERASQINSGGGGGGGGFIGNIGGTAMAGAGFGGLVVASTRAELHNSLDTNAQNL
jgi:hypothetical protein